MRIRLKTIITCLLIFAAVHLRAQLTNIGFTLSTEANTTQYKLSGNQFYPLYVPMGSEFMNDDWQKGYVILENQDRYDSLHLKLNTYKDELIWLHSRSSSLVELDKSTIREFGFYSETGLPMMFRKLEMNIVPKGDHYFRMLYNGKLKLVIWFKTTEEEVPAYTDKYGYMRNTNFKMRSNYFLIFPDNDFERFRLKRMPFLYLFGEKQKEVRKLLRKNKNRLMKESDFINAVQLIDREFY
ncbi:hypothetical protein [Maribellus sp. YY47]|uniref:hypothetical protein n=1 Tax=Maribellus sp. YY47 TaxID=2929486 RepID=UPI0020010CCC|nr:hypothetical protein [Maribellus sp. YY47]MCK3682859.1 hypothetical protein [Maribellus sp. YY47]